MPLSPRERAVAERIMRGEKFEAIAADLKISYWTVKAYARNIRTKSGKGTNIEAVLFFVSDTAHRDSYLYRQLTLF